MENLKLYKKLFDIMCETKSLEKNLTVGKGANTYKAVGEAEVLNMLKPLFNKHKVIVFPIDGSMQETSQIWESESYDKKETKTRNVTQLKVSFKVVDVESGEFEILAGFGNGADPQDKGSGKAFTYAYKTMLNKTFMMFSGEDTDNTHSDDIGTPSSKPFADTEKENAKWNKEVNSKIDAEETTDKATKDEVAKIFREGRKKKESISDFDVFKMIDEKFEEGKISTKYPYSDKEKTKINWVTKDIEILMNELSLPF
ncbi:MAG: ERF family protein [Bacteroidales bacterium]|nr:ERF family protein [Bacteroidales bacterium]